MRVGVDRVSMTLINRVTLTWDMGMALGQVEGPLPDRLDSAAVTLWRIGRDRQPPPVGVYVRDGEAVYRLEVES